VAVFENSEQKFSGGCCLDFWKIRKKTLKFE
jgi:hypothetical protein